MTYAQLIEEVKQSALPLVQTTTWQTDGAIYAIVNRASRRLGMVLKDSQASASLAIVAGTSTYTISSAIASNVDEITLIRAGNQEVIFKDTVEFERLSINGDITGETDAETNSEQLYARVYNGILEFYPEPSLTQTATVYYNTKQTKTDISTANLATDIVGLREDYLTPLIYLSVGMMYEAEKMYEDATYWKTNAMALVEEAKENQPDYNYGEQLKYHSALD